MDNKQENKSSFPFPAMLLIAAVIAGGVFKFYVPLDSMRPQSGDKIAKLQLGEERVLARMWQDPFQAVERHLQNLKDDNKDSSISFQPKTGKQIERMLIMPVLTTAGNYAQKIERRLNSRYALLSALHVAGYRSENASHIGVFKFDEFRNWKRKKDVEESKTSALRKFKKSKDKLKILEDEHVKNIKEVADAKKSLDDGKQKLSNFHTKLEENSYKIDQLEIKQEMVKTKIAEAESDNEDAMRELKKAEQDFINFIDEFNEGSNINSNHLIPYEWFVFDRLDVKAAGLYQNDKKNYDKILVLWMADEFFSGDRRLEELNDLFEYISSFDLSIEIDRKVLGPSNSVILEKTILNDSGMLVQYKEVPQLIKKMENGKKEIVRRFDAAMGDLAILKQKKLEVIDEVSRLENVRKSVEDKLDEAKNKVEVAKKEKGKAEENLKSFNLQSDNAKPKTSDSPDNTENKQKSDVGRRAEAVSGINDANSKLEAAEKRLSRHKADLYEVGLELNEESRQLENEQKRMELKIVEAEQVVDDAEDTLDDAWYDLDDLDEQLYRMEQEYKKKNKIEKPDEQKVMELKIARAEQEVKDAEGTLDDLDKQLYRMTQEAKDKKGDEKPEVQKRVEIKITEAEQVVKEAKTTLDEQLYRMEQETKNNKEKFDEQKRLELEIKKTEQVIKGAQDTLDDAWSELDDLDEQLYRMKQEEKKKNKKERPEEQKGLELEIKKTEQVINDAQDILDDAWSELDGLDEQLYRMKQDEKKKSKKEKPEEQKMIELKIDKAKEEVDDAEDTLDDAWYELVDRKEQLIRMKQAAQRNKGLLYGILNKAKNKVVVAKKEKGKAEENLHNVKNLIAKLNKKNANQRLSDAEKNLTKSNAEVSKKLRATSIFRKDITKKQVSIEGKLVKLNEKVKTAEEYTEKLREEIKLFQETINNLVSLIEKKTNFDMYSPWASVDTLLLDYKVVLKRGNKKLESVQQVLSKLEGDDSSNGNFHLNFVSDSLNVSLKRSIHTDLQLTDQLVKELKRRGVELGSRGTDHIVLVSEWDTFYGRALPLSFAISIERDREEPSDTPWTKRIHKVTYMRGLDGMIPSVDNGSNLSVSKYTKTSNKKDNSSNYFTPEFKQPLGQAQFDYIRRLVDRIKQLPFDSNGRHGEEIRAIGVLGSDIYDKLLILRALRASFPNAIFFTNDINALLYYNTELPWTQNLIIASSYGLELHPHLQRDIPPFRSVYQSSLFVATLQAMGIKDDDIDFKRIKPRIFEIGRRGPYDLTPISSSPEFYRDEFVDFSEKKLCEEIEKHIHTIKSSINITAHNTDWLNELLIKPELYSALHKEGQKDNVIKRVLANIRAFIIEELNINLTYNVQILAKETKADREKNYDTLSDDKQMKIRMLNRLVLEKVFYNYTPKMYANILHPDRSDSWKNVSRKSLITHIFFLLFLPLLLFAWLIYCNLKDAKYTKIDQKYMKTKKDLLQAEGKEVKSRAYKKFRMAKNRLKKIKSKKRFIWKCFGVPCIVSFVALTYIVLKSSLNGDGEPLTFIDSISIWPSEIIRLFSGFLAIYFLLLSIQSLIRNCKEVNLIFLNVKEKPNTSNTTNQTLSNIYGSWKKYGADTKAIKKCIYITGIFVLVYFGASQAYLGIFGRPPVPFRGNLSKYTDLCILIFSLLSMLFLSWFVINTIRYCRKYFSEIIDLKNQRFMSNILNISCSVKEAISKIGCENIDEACQKEYADCLSEYDKCVSGNILVQWLRINIIAKRTEVIGKMIIYPFVIFALLLISRNKFFDNWTWTIPLILVVSLTIFITLYYAFVLFYDANVARKQTITHLHEERLELMNTQIPSDFDAANDRKTKLIEQKLKYIDDIIEDLKHLKRGAFAPIGNNPLLIAILAPLGGLGSIAILQHLPQLLNK